MMIIFFFVLITKITKITLKQTCKHHNKVTQITKNNTPIMTGRGK